MKLRKTEGEKQMTQETELKPCPFCGSKAHFEIDDDRWEWIECGSCGMQGNRSASLMEDCKPKLAEAWNRRAALEAKQAEVHMPEPVGKVSKQGWASWNGVVREGDELYTKQQLRALVAQHGIKIAD